MSRKRKAKRRLEQSRKRGFLKEKIRFAETKAALLAQQYEDAMIAMYRDSNATQRAALEVEYQKIAGSSLKRAFEARIIAALAKSAARRL